MAAHRLATLLTVIFATGAAAAQTPASAQYQVVQDVPTLHGHLLILEDARIDRTLEKEMWDGCTDPYLLLGDGNPRLKLFAGRAPAPAKLQQVVDGKLIAEETPDPSAPIARIETKLLGAPDNPVVLVDTDDDACAGSYSGRAAQIHQFLAGRIAPIRLADQTGKPHILLMFNALKSAGRLEPTTAPDILIHEVRCAPDDAHISTDRNAPLPFRIRYPACGKATAIFRRSRSFPDRYFTPSSATPSRRGSEPPS